MQLIAPVESNSRHYRKAFVVIHATPAFVQELEQCAELISSAVTVDPELHSLEIGTNENSTVSPYWGFQSEVEEPTVELHQMDEDGNWFTPESTVYPTINLEREFHQMLIAEPGGVFRWRLVNAVNGTRFVTPSLHLEAIRSFLEPAPEEAAE